MNAKSEIPTWRPPPPQVSERRSVSAIVRRRHPAACVELVFASANDNRREP